jgi:hypothetical protein
MVIRLISVSDQLQLPEFHDAFTGLGYEQVNNSSSGSEKRSSEFWKRPQGNLQAGQ